MIRNIKQNHGEYFSFPELFPAVLSILWNFAGAAET